MSEEPVCAMVWEGKHAVKVGRVIIGATYPSDAETSSIRGSHARVCPQKADMTVQRSLQVCRTSAEIFVMDLIPSRVQGVKYAFGLQRMTLLCIRTLWLHSSSSNDI